MAASITRKVVGHLRVLYPHLTSEALEALADRLVDTLVDTLSAGAQPNPAGTELWSERDVVLIAYGDSVTCAPEAPLATLERTLSERFADVISTAHVLPFFPFTSDDGFAVTDHAAVAAHLGTEADVQALAGRFNLMADLIVNHVSFSHRWVQQFLADEEPGRRLLRTIGGDEDLSHVTRPRTSPLGRPVETAGGNHELWCTFSHDQVDLDYREPDTLVELLKVLRWLLDLGARWLRLDAVAYVWDASGTTCVHLPETHEIVKLLRTLVDGCAAGTVIVTETNVPHEDNVSYFGDGDEAHVIYNFTLPPLLTHALLSGSAATLQRWLDNLDPPPAGCTVLNFLASHDGIGLRPAEGLLDDEQIATLVAASHAAGGCHSEYATETGARPYEINVSLFDLLAPEGDPHGVDRYLAAHTVMLALAGVPAFYLHGILGTPNHQRSEPAVDAATPTATARQVNRRKLTTDELAELAERPDGIFDEMKRRTLIRRCQPAFHPSSSQQSRFVDERVVSVVRGAGPAGKGPAEAGLPETGLPETGLPETGLPETGRDAAPIWCVTNVTDQPVVLAGSRRALAGDALAGDALAGDALAGDLVDLLSDTRCAADTPIELAPYASLWLTRPRS